MAQPDRVSLYLISHECWTADRTRFLERPGLTDFADPNPVLTKLDETLHRQYQQTNAAIRDSTNTHLKIAANGSFQVATPAQEEFDSEPLRQHRPRAAVAASDRVVAAMDRMELPSLYRRSQETLHTPSDGQKFEVRCESLNASYSFKYFGKGQGVSAYTFIDERNILWHSLVFSASERESAYVIDVVRRFSRTNGVHRLNP